MQLYYPTEITIYVEYRHHYRPKSLNMSIFLNTYVAWIPFAILV